MICAFCFSGCTNSSEYYVQGLVNLSSQENNKAIKNFEKAIKNGSSLEVLLSLKELKKLNISKTKMLSLTKIAISQNKKPEDETYNFYLQALIDNQKFEQAIKFSNSLLNSNIKNDWMMYCFCYATVMKEQNLESVIVKDWLTQESFSDYHAKFIEEIFIGEFANKLILQNDFKFLLEFRNLVYEKKYSVALEKLSFVLKDFENILEFSPQTISDIGKSFLYGSSEQIKLLFGFESRSEVAKSLKNISSKKFDNTEKEKLFYTNFYAGRIFDKSGNQYFNLAKECFLSAIENSINDITFDNALLCYLNQLKKESIKSLITGIEKYGLLWKDKTYYSDLLNEIKLFLLSTRQWTLFCNFYKTIEQVADEEIKTAWAYLTARLIKEEFVSVQNFSNYDIRQMFNSVFENSQSPLYYRIMSAYQNKIEPKMILKNMCQSTEFVSIDKIKTESLYNLFSACVKYGQIKKFYGILNEYKKYISSDDLSFFVKKINQNFGSNENLYPTILRISSEVFSNSGSGKDEEVLKLFYPRNFYDFVKFYANEYNLSESLLFSLIRTESYFDKNVFSVAGASGLTQLMKTTATDIARKLRIKDFDLLDAKTNITFGSFYLNELIRRLDGSVLKAIVSYNTGITRVRRWATQFENVPTDIWIEMFPYQESRNYGKRVLANAFVYGLLYYNKTSYEIVDMFMR
jgi:soluble lytic murein transglycosylase